MTGCRATPGGQPLQVGQARVQQRRFDAEALAKTRDELRCQANLRHEHQDLLAPGEHLFDKVKVDLGLAAAGNAVEYEGGEPVGCTHGIDGFPLFVVEFGARRCLAGLDVIVLACA